MKRIVFLIIASLMVVGLVLPSAVVAQPTQKIQVLIAGPMEYIQGQDMWNGADLANTGLTFSHDGTDYEFELKQVETDEIDNYAEAGVKLEGATEDNPNAKIIIGGYRSEAVANMIPVAIDAGALFFICGAATSSLLSDAYSYDGSSWHYEENYKYIFRGTPFNDIFLLDSAIQVLGMVVETIKNNGISTPKVAIFAESLDWADPIVAAAEELIPSSVLGCILGPVKRVSDNAEASVVIPMLNEIKAESCHVIFTVMSGPVGTVFSTQRGALITAIPVGINVEAQDPDFWDKTVGGCNHEITLAAWAPGVEQTPKTKPFLDAYDEDYDDFPTYTAASYDILLGLAEAIKAEGWDPNDLGPIIEWYEGSIDHPQGTTTGYTAYYPRWDTVTEGQWQGTGPSLPALNPDQISAIYGLSGNGFTMPPYTTHDLVYGPTWETGIAIQWQLGKQVQL